LVGTAHISQRSVQEVEDAIRRDRPAKVLVELDERRFEALRDPDAWRKTDIIQVLRQKKQHLFLLQLYLASMQARMGRETGVSPGAEMLRAIQVADEIGAEVVLVDRDVAITLKRGFGAMNLWQRMRLFWNVWMELLTPSDDSKAELDVDALLETDAITTMTEEFARFAPVVKTALIDERDQYMASHIHEQAATGTLVAVVGAGHVAGIVKHLESPEGIPARAELDLPPRKRITLGKVIAYALPLAVLGGFAYLAFTGDFAELRRVWVYWILVNGSLSALGALLARGHILSAVVAFIAAPITSLSPALAAGWFAGAAEAKLHTPTVADFEAIKAIDTMRDFWRNGVVRVLLVTALANLGSVAGSWLGLVELAQSLGGS
jgi:pheromone shutdown-related protein TraB